MDEIEVVDGVVDAFEAGEAGGINAAEQIGAEVENDAAVREVAELPDIANSPEAQASLRETIAKNPFAQKLWAFAKFVAGGTATAAIMFGVMYGLNKAIAKSAQETGKRTSLTSYLAQVQANWKAQNLPWTDDVKVQAATLALGFPWIDSST